jgi:hypothetical protein
MQVHVQNLASKLGEAGNMYLGLLPKVEWGRVCEVCAPLELDSPHQQKGCLAWLCVWLEALFVPIIARTAWVKSMCLPSSNGFWTARAVAKMYGALANHGVFGKDGTVAYSEKLVDVIHSNLGPEYDVKGFDTDEKAHLALGFSPWPDKRMCNGKRVLAHGGMGGTYAFGDLDRGLAVCVLKNSYTPISLNGDVICDSTVEIMDLITSLSDRYAATHPT